MNEAEEMEREADMTERRENRGADSELLLALFAVYWRSKCTNHSSAYLCKGGKFMKGTVRSKRFIALVAVAMAGVITLSLLAGSLTRVYAANRVQGPPQHLKEGQLWTGGKGKVNQSAAFIQAKNAHQINPLGKVTPLSDPSSYTLTMIQSFEEPLAYGYQDARGGVGQGAYYTDEYNWYDCGPGAAAVASWFWIAAPFPPAGTYRDPHTSLYWLTAYGKQNVMYLAYVINPPNSGWTSPGVMTYETYPNAYTANTDLLIGMQYEASGESSDWQGYYYVLVGPGSISASTLLSDVEYDTYSYGVPLVVGVNDSYLPDWQNSNYKGSSHDIAILGYNNSNSTYTYYETCGPGAAACETSGYGIHTISQSQLYSAIENDNGNGAEIW